MALTTVKTTALSGTITNAQLAGSIDLTAKVTGTLPTGNGGTGSTATTFVNMTSNVTGTLPAANGGTGATTFSPGKILQVVEDGDTGYVETTSTDYLDTGAQVAITPSATSSKIWIQYIAPAWSKSNDGYNIFLQLLVDVAGGGYSLVRIMTQMNASGTYSASGGSGTIHNGANFAFSELLSPSTTSALTYKVQWKLNGASTMWKNNYNSTASQARGSLVVMEVGA